MKWGLLAAVTLVVQRILGAPGMPQSGELLILPIIWIVGPSLLQYDRRWTQLAILLGIGWDVLLEPIIGPGGIAWGAAALVLSVLASFVADRSPKAWFAFGAAGTVLVVTVRSLALLPLGVSSPLEWRRLLLTTVVTAVWCGTVGWIRVLDLPSRWHTFRARKLR